MAFSITQMQTEPSFRCRPWWSLVAAAWVPCVAREQPWIALGLAGNLNADNAVVRQAVASWLDAGGRAVDAALMYYNDEGLRQGLEGFYGPPSDPKDSSEPSASASEVFVTTKIPPEQMGFDRTLEAIVEAREKILPAGRSSKTLDCVLIHWPGRTWRKRHSDPGCVVDRGAAAADWSVCRRESWAALQHAKAMGMVGLIGVSNYELPHLEEMDSVPDVLQIEFHPWWNRADLLQWCRERRVKLVAYSSLGGPGSTWLGDPTLAQLARQEGLTVAQLLLNWAVSQGAAVIPSARSRKHMEENLACCQQALSAETLNAMSAPLEAQHRTIEPDPRWIYVPGVAATAFGGPKPPSHAHLNLFGGVEQFHFGSLRKHCWQEGRTPHLCCDPAFGPEGFSTCWTGELSFIECCTPTTDKLVLHPAVGDSLAFSNSLVDFIVVGAGSAGSIAASRLARKGFTVVVAESGGDGLSSKNVHPNPSSAEQFDHWFVHNVEWTLGEVSRTTQIIHGRGLGGSSSVNGKIYTRTPLPFSPAMVSAAYEDVESDLLLEQDVIPIESWQRAVLDGFEAAGIPYVHNASMSFKHGVGPVQKISSCKNGGRVSAFHCALGKGDAEVLRNAHVDRVIFQDGQAVGVNLAGDVKANLFCRHGVILSAGALQTPVILVRSGIGHPMDLQRLGVETQVSSLEVGANLQDHPYLPFRVRTSLPCVDGDGSLYAFYSNLTAPSSRHRIFELQLIPRCRGQNMELKGYLILLKSEMKSGRVVVRSRDATEPPAILNNPFVGDGIDAWQLIHGLREVYQLLKALGSCGLREFDPPQESLMKDGFGGQYCAQHLGLWQHPMGSARIGSVLDHHLRVRGVGQLYVADASALPDWALAGHPDAGIRAVGSLVAQFATEDLQIKRVRQRTFIWTKQGCG